MFVLVFTALGFFLGHFIQLGIVHPLSCAGGIWFRPVSCLETVLSKFVLFGSRT